MTDRVTRGRRAHALGHDAEASAARLLVAGGARILATRYRTPHGEIDIVAATITSGRAAFVSSPDSRIVASLKST